MRTFLLGAAIGYVLGTKAGRARYEQIVRTYRMVIDHPAVQGAAGVVRAKLGEKVGEKVPFIHSDGHRKTEPTVTDA